MRRAGGGPAVACKPRHEWFPVVKLILVGLVAAVSPHLVRAPALVRLTAFTCLWVGQGVALVMLIPAVLEEVAEGRCIVALRVVRGLELGLDGLLEVYGASSDRERRA